MQFSKNMLGITHVEYYIFYYEKQIFYGAGEILLHENFDKFELTVS